MMLDDLTPAQVAGARLADARDFSGLSVGQAANRLGLRRVELESFERGEVRPHDATIDLMVRLYNAPVRSYLDLLWEPPTPDPELERELAAFADSAPAFSERDRAWTMRIAQQVREAAAAMAQRKPIFSADDVRALRGGNKTQHRLPMWTQPSVSDDGAHLRWGDIVVEVGSARELAKLCPYANVGNELYIREPCWVDRKAPAGGHRAYFDDGVMVHQKSGPRTAPLHRRSAEDFPAEYFERLPPERMPPWAARLAIEVVGVRVERLLAVTPADAEAEGLEVRLTAGVDVTIDGDLWAAGDREVRRAFAAWWDERHGELTPWSSDPWVWVLMFKPCKVVRRG